MEKLKTLAEEIAERREQENEIILPYLESLAETLAIALLSPSVRHAVSEQERAEKIVAFLVEKRKKGGLVK